MDLMTSRQFSGCNYFNVSLVILFQVSELSKLALPWTLGGNLVRQPVTLLDVCYGKIENVNLRYVVRINNNLKYKQKCFTGSLGFLNSSFIHFYRKIF